MAVNRPNTHTPIQPQNPDAAKTDGNHKPCFWPRGVRRVKSLPLESTTPMIKQAAGKSPSQHNLRRTFSCYGVTPVKSVVHQRLQQGRIRDFSLALQTRDLKQLIDITSKTYDFPTLLVMAETLIDTTKLQNIEEPMLATTWQTLQEAISDVLFFRFGGYSNDGLDKDCVAKASGTLGELPNDICDEILKPLIIKTLGIHEKRLETRLFIETIADHDFDQAEALLNNNDNQKILEYMGKKALSLGKYHSTQEAGLKGAEIVQNRLKELKAEHLFHHYGGHNPEGPAPNFIDDAINNELSNYPTHFVNDVVKRLKSKQKPEQIAEELLTRLIGTNLTSQLFSRDDIPDSSETAGPDRTILNSLDTGKIMNSCKAELSEYTEEFMEEVLAIIDLILMPEDAPDYLPPEPPPKLPHSTNRNKG